MGGRGGDVCVRVCARLLTTDEPTRVWVASFCLAWASGQVAHSSLVPEELQESDENIVACYEHIMMNTVG